MHAAARRRPRHRPQTGRRGRALQDLEPSAAGTPTPARGVQPAARRLPRPSTNAAVAAWPTSRSLSAIDRGCPCDPARLRPQRGPKVEGGPLRPEPGAALPAGQLIDVAVRRAKVAPTSAALIHLAPEKLHAGCLQLPDGAGKIVDHEADDGTGREVGVVHIAWTKHLERTALRQFEGGEVGPFLAGGQPEDGLEECHHGGVLACPRARPANALDPHACSLPCSGASRPRSGYVAANVHRRSPAASASCRRPAWRRYQPADRPWSSRRGVTGGSEPVASAV